MKKIVVLYHDDQDGFGGAWAAWKKFKNKASYIPLQYTETNLPPKGLKGKEVYLIDFCYDAASMRKLLKDNRKVVVLDHHETRRKETAISTEHLFSVKNSGAVLAWYYFHPKKKIPKLLLYVEDMDLWLFRLKETKIIMTALELYDYKFSVWEKIAKELKNSRTRKKFLQQGEIVLKYQSNLIDKIIIQANPAVFEGKKALAVNSNILESEIGNTLVKKGAEVAIIWFIKNGGKLKVSLRSNPNKVNVAKLAKPYGGGGHKGAAGFTVKLKNGKLFPWKTK